MGYAVKYNVRTSKEWLRHAEALLRLHNVPVLSSDQKIARDLRIESLLLTDVAIGESAAPAVDEVPILNVFCPLPDSDGNNVCFSLDVTLFNDNNFGQMYLQASKYCRA